MNRPARPVPVIWAESKPSILRRRNRWRRNALAYNELKDELCVWRPPYVYHLSTLLAVYAIATYFTHYFVVALIMFPFLYVSILGYMIGVCKLLMIIDENAMESGRYGRIMRSDWYEFTVLDEYLQAHGYRLHRLIQHASTAHLIEQYIRDYLDSTCDARIALRHSPIIKSDSPALASVQRAAGIAAKDIHRALQNSKDYNASLP